MMRRHSSRAHLLEAINSSSLNEVTDEAPRRAAQAVCPSGRSGTLLVRGGWRSSGCRVSTHLSWPCFLLTYLFWPDVVTGQRRWPDIRHDRCLPFLLCSGRWERPVRRKTQAAAGAAGWRTRIDGINGGARCAATEWAPINRQLNTMSMTRNILLVRHCSASGELLTQCRPLVYCGRHDRAGNGP
jgi:hypothetical protein